MRCFKTATQYLLGGRGACFGIGGGSGISADAWEGRGFQLRWGGEGQHAGSKEWPVDNVLLDYEGEGLLLINWPTFRLTSRWFLA